ncbi:antitoxin AF2212-like protein [Thermococcus peptonophilus]|uniref:Antitoxin n=1 Tax=Thermococcus peptonophilus TaxID=53952 RepID=A0A142CVC7_9EURY|nr:antitoxin AF2212-like protein [Thermococcus peptonophilus]AMQ18729.1 antitoxin [Thermococcus peptonophilus]
MEVVEAVYENGVLKLKKKLNLPDGTEVSVKLIPKKISEKTFGIVKLGKEEVDKIIEEIEDEW